MRKELIATKAKRQWQGIPTIERSANGRLWCAFFSGGSKEPEPENFILLTTSMDNGASWSNPKPIVVPDGMTRAYDPALWHASNGDLWLFYNEANLETKTFSVYAVTTNDSSDPEPLWSKPKRLNLDVPFAFRLNKPTILTTGAWLLPVTWSRTTPEDWFAGPQQRQGVAISTDRGATWKLHGEVEAPHWALENMIIERRDETLWMLIRTGSGVLWESISLDRGNTWSPGKPTDIVNPGSRFFIGRLASGRLLLINTPDPKQRKGLFAYLSETDDDTGFGVGLELDARNAVSYPDAVQSPDGTLYTVHDRDRYGPGEILLSVFTEDEILAEQSHAEATANSRA
jgi:predicted neuraminidase